MAEFNAKYYCHFTDDSKIFCNRYSTTYEYLCDDHKYHQYAININDPMFYYNQHNDSISEYIGTQLLLLRMFSPFDKVPVYVELFDKLVKNKWFLNENQSVKNSLKGILFDLEHKEHPSEATNYHLLKFDHWNNELFSQNEQVEVHIDLENVKELSIDI
jgi:hypothetical protein